MGAAYLCYMTGIQNATIDNSAAYIKSWIGKFMEDKKMLLMASSQAQKAVDYILEHQSYLNQPAVAIQVEQKAEAV